MKLESLKGINKGILKYLIQYGTIYFNSTHTLKYNKKSIIK